MSYSGGRLSPMFSREPIRRACEKMAKHGAESMTRWTRINTPIGHQQFPSPGYMPGTLRASIHEKVMVVYPSARGMVYESGAETNVEWAPYVESGTGIYHIPNAHQPWIIRPKNPDGWLRWIDQATGNPVFAKEVVQKGIHPQGMFAIGAHMSEHEFETIIAPEALAAWSREHELMFESQPPIYIGARA